MLPFSIHFKCVEFSWTSSSQVILWGGMRDLESFLNILVKECPLQLEQWSGLYFVNGIFFGKVVVLGRTLNFWAWFLIFLYFASCPPTFLEAVPYQEGHCGLTYFPSLFLGKPMFKSSGLWLVLRCSSSGNDALFLGPCPMCFIPTSDLLLSPLFHVIPTQFCSSLGSESGSTDSGLFSYLHENKCVVFYSPYYSLCMGYYVILFALLFVCVVLVDVCRNLDLRN